MHDLRAINSIVEPKTPVVPDPHTLLSNIPHDACWYTVIDLCSAFFSVPLHHHSQYLLSLFRDGSTHTHASHRASCWEPVNIQQGPIPQQPRVQTPHVAHELSHITHTLPTPLPPELYHYIMDCILHTEHTSFALDCVLCMGHYLKHWTFALQIGTWTPYTLMKS